MPQIRRIGELVLLWALCSAPSDCQLQQPQQSPDAVKLIELGDRSESEGKLSEAFGYFQAALKSDPANAQANFRIGLLKGQAGDFTGAEGAFRRALKTDPSFPEAHYNLGLSIIGESKNSPEWTRALAEFRAALALRPQYAEALNKIGVCLLELGDPTGSIAQFKAALVLYPNSAEIHFNLGRAFEASGNKSGASTEYLRAIQIKKVYPEAEVALGNLWAGQGNYSTAIEKFAAALTADPDLEPAHYALAKALRSSGATDESQIEFKEASALLQRQSDAIMSSHLSNESLNRAKSGDLSDAIQAARKAVELDPENAIALYNLGLLVADSGDLEAASRQLRKAISLAPLQVHFYVSLARMQEMMKRRTDAIISLSRAVRLDPTDPNLKLRLQALEPASTSTAEKVVSADEKPFQYGARSDSADDHFAFATELSKEGDVPGAVGELLRALTLRPARSDIRYNLAVAYIEMGRYGDADLELRKVLRGSPNSVEAHIALGTVLLQEKEKDHAAEEFRRALSLQPANRQAEQLLRECQD